MVAAPFKPILFHVRELPQKSRARRSSSRPSRSQDEEHSDNLNARDDEQSADSGEAARL
jgi:hypothetical protein